MRRGHGALTERDVGLLVASSAAATFGSHARVFFAVAAALACAALVAIVRGRRRRAEMQSRTATAALVAVLAAIVLAASIFARCLRPTAEFVRVATSYVIEVEPATPPSLPSVPVAFQALGALGLALSLAGIAATPRRTRWDAGAAPYRGASLAVTAVGARGVAPATAVALVLLAPLAITVTERLARYAFG